VGRMLLLAVGVVPVAVAMMSAPRLRAQSQPPASMAFEVASIKPHQGDVITVGGPLSGSRVRLVAMTLTNLIKDAYHREPYQISGAQGWMDSERYDILANEPAEIAPTEDNVRLMLQALLVNRFRWKIHWETKESPVYAMVVAKNGPKLKQSTANEFSGSMTAGRSIPMTFSKATTEQLASEFSDNDGASAIDDRLRSLL
jgi:uncharacterized protein (TIGR03435 family)